MASVRKRRGRWFARLKYATGQQREKALPTEITTRADALRLAHEIEQREWRIREGLQVPPSSETIDSAVKRYLHAIRHQKSIGHMKCRFERHVIPVIGKEPVALLKPSQAQSVIGTMQDKGLEPSYQRLVFSSLRTMYEWLRRDGVVQANPLALLRAPRVPPPSPKALTIEQVYAVAAKAEWPSMRNLILLAFFTACRPGELRAARWTDVDFGAAQLRVERTDGSTTTKTGRARVAFLPGPAIQLLLEMKRTATSAYLFTEPDGSPMRKRPVWRGFKRAMVAAGLVGAWHTYCPKRKACGFLEERRKQEGEKCPRCGRQLRERGLPPDVSTKDLRSSAVTYLCEQVGTHVAQAQAGHTSLKTTETHYRAVRAPHIAAAVSRAFSAPPPPGEPTPEPVGPYVH